MEMKQQDMKVGEPIVFNRRHSDSPTLRPGDFDTLRAFPTLSSEASQSSHSLRSPDTWSGGAARTSPLSTSPHGPLSVTIAPPARDRRPSTADKPKSGFKWKQTFNRLRSRTISTMPSAKQPGSAHQPLLLEQPVELEQPVSPTQPESPTQRAWPMQIVSPTQLASPTQLSPPRSPSHSPTFPKEPYVSPALPPKPSRPRVITAASAPPAYTTRPVTTNDSLPRPKRISRLAKASEELFSAFHHQQPTHPMPKPTSPSLTSLQHVPTSPSSRSPNSMHANSAMLDAPSRLVKRESSSLTKLRERYVAGGNAKQLRRVGSWRTATEERDGDDDDKLPEETLAATKPRRAPHTSHGRPSLSEEPLLRQRSRLPRVDSGDDAATDDARDTDQDEHRPMHERNPKVHRSTPRRSVSARCSTVQQPAFVGQWNSDDMAEVIKRLRSLKSEY